MARVLRAHGIEGDLRLIPFADDPQNIAAGALVFIGAEEYRVRSVRDVSGGLIVTLSGIPTREAAEALAGSLVEMRRTDLGPLEEGSYYVTDLIGLSAVNEEHEPLGVVSDVLATGANDVYVIERPDGSELLLPAIPDVVLQIVINDGVMVVRPQDPESD